MRHFIKAGQVIYSVDEKGNLITPNVTDIPSRAEFYQYGLESLDGIFTPSNSMTITMDRGIELGEGATFSKVITPAEFSRQIKRIRNARK